VVPLDPESQKILAHRLDLETQLHLVTPQNRSNRQVREVPVARVILLSLRLQVLQYFQRIHLVLEDQLHLLIPVIREIQPHHLFRNYQMVL